MARIGMDSKSFHRIMNDFDLREHVMEAKRLGKIRKKRREFKSIIVNYKQWLAKLERLEKEM